MYLLSVRHNDLIYRLVLLFFCINMPAAADTFVDHKLFIQYCAECHGADRLGSSGPALLPQNLSRLKKQHALEVITNGAPATQMPAFGDVLSAADINMLTEYIYSIPEVVPEWEAREINDSQAIYYKPGELGDRAIHQADPMNLFIVVETGDHHATILDGDRLEPIHRFKTRHALHGGPKYSPTGRYVYLASRDGWVSKFDMYNLKIIAEIRVGINTRNIAASSDGRYIIAGNYLPHSLVVLDATDLSLLKVIKVNDGRGKHSRVSAVYDAPPRKSFIVALKDLKEIWEIPYDENAEPIYNGLVHDYRYNEAIPVPGPFPVRRIRLDDYLDDFFFTQDYQSVIGAARNSKNGQVVNLLVGRKIADIDLPGLPHLGSGISWTAGNRRIIATPNLKDGVVSIIDPNSWKTIKRINTSGPGFFMRSHENTPYAWVDVFFGPNKDVVHVIDKDKLEIIRTLRPAPGKTSAHVEFTRDGRYALLSIWDKQGALVIYDGESLEEVKRIPMNKPSGKYNVYNKISGSAGTSH